MKLTILPVLTLCLCLGLSGCSSWQAYDKDNPDEYMTYWQKEENRKDSIVYPYTDEYKQETKGMKR
jgi:uncharacterized protein YceK